jgi:hypothetical protein
MSRKPIVRMQESFKIFVDKFNILSNNVGDPLQLNTYQDSDLVTVINEIEATFDASAGEILYPNGQAGETQTRLKISTNQSSGTDIDIDAGRDFLVDAVADIELTSVNFEGDYSGTYIVNTEGNFTDSVGGIRSITTTGNHNIDTLGALVVNATGGHIDLNASNDIILDAGADVILDAGDSDIFFRRQGTVFVKTQMGMDGDASLTRQLYQQGGLELDVAGNLNLDVSGDITLDADGNDIIFKNGTGADQVTHTLADGAGYTVTAPGSYTLDVVGDIILDADGNDLVFRNGAGADSAQINLANDGNFTVTTPNSLTLDVSGDINIDAAGDNIRLKDGGTTRQEYTLGTTTTIATSGNRTETVTGNVSDSAAGTYSIGATGNMDIDTRGTLDVVTGGNLSIDTTGNTLVKTTGSITLDAETDIVLDANGADIVMKDNGVNKFTFNFAADQEIDVVGSLTLDVQNDLTLDVGDSDLIFSRQGTQFVKTQMGMAGDANLVRQLYSQGGLELDVAGNFTVDATGDIILDAAADDVILKDAGTEFGRFKHIGDNQLGIYSNGILAASFNDSDVVFNSDVNIEDNLDVDGTLNVDGNTTLNGGVDLGNAAADDISINGKVDTNILPKTTNAHNIGSSSLQWRHAWFDGTVFADNLDGDSGTIANFNINTNTISNSSAGLIVDVAGDITLNAADDDIIFEGSFNGVDSSRVHFDLGNDNSSVVQRIVNRNLVLEVDKNIYLDANEGYINFRDSANDTRVQFDYDHALSGGTEMKVYGGSLTMDVAGDIVLDADGGDVLLKDAGTQFGRFQNTAGNLIVRSGDTTVLTFSGANVTTAGTITPGTTLNTTATDLVGAINEVDSDLGTITSLSSFYDSHNQDIVTALNRVADRIIDVYDASGTLLNN